MTFKVWLTSTVVVLALLPLGIVRANKTEVIVKADNKADFSAVVAAVRKEMLPAGRYEFVDNTERDTINAKFADMQSIFDKSDTVAEMSQDAKVQLFNDQEAVNAILTHRDDKRLVCENIAPIGSHIPRTSCKTYREIQVQQLGTKNYLQRLQQVPQPVGGH